MASRMAGPFSDSGAWFCAKPKLFEFAIEQLLSKPLQVIRPFLQPAQMGSSPSKPEAKSSQHVFQADHPVQFSESLVNSLQNNSETDSSRARNLELVIQQRVTSELEKHLKASSERLASLSDSISKEPIKQGKKSTSSASWTEKPLVTRIAERIRGVDQQESDAQMAKTGIDRDAVAKEIEEMKQKLNGRKKLVEVDMDVERAKEAVIICLRKNDRRPLDCWQEVENFKREVGRLEKDFVDKNAS